MPDSSSAPDTWLERYGDRLYSYAMMRLRDADRAQDAVQDTLLAALQSRDRFMGASTELTWLIGILRHKVLDQLRVVSRDETRQVAVEDDNALERMRFDGSGYWTQGPGAWGGPEQALQDSEFVGSLASCVESLPRRLADVFVLREVDGLPSDELREVLGVSSNNLWVMLSRARMRLRECLEHHWIDGKQR